VFSDEYNLSSTYAGGRGQQENTGWNPERDWFSLNNEVGLGRKNNRSDVLKVQSILGESGHYDLERTDGPTGFMGSDFDENIKDFQRDNGLEVDGWLKPNGPTIKTMKKKLGSIFGEYPAPTPDEVEQHHVSLKSGGKPLLQHRPPVPVLQPIEDLPEIDDEDQGAIGRSVKYLLNYSDPGEHPQDTARIIRDVGDYGLAYGRELVEEIRAKDPELGNKYLLRLLENLSAQLQTLFIGGPKPKHIPLGVPRPDLFPEYSPEWEKLKRRRGEWDSDSRILDLTTPPYVPEYMLHAAPDAGGKILRHPGEADEEGYKSDETPYIGGDLPPPLPPRQTQLQQEQAPEEQPPEDQSSSSNPREAFDRTMFHGHVNNNLRDEFDRSILDQDIEGQISEQNKIGFRKLITDSDRPPPKIDMDKFADALNKNAHEKSKEECAAYVRRALKISGADTDGHPKQAKNWGPTLERNGFVMLDKTNYTPQKGDVVVIQPYKGGNDAGHMAAYDGKQWISDFKQRDFWGGKEYRRIQHSHEIYRHIP
jgi:hypothetical protein